MMCSLKMTVKATALAALLIVQGATAQVAIEYAQVEGVDRNLLSLDVYAPDSADRLPVMVYVHGGGWQNGDKSRAEHLAEAFNREGYIFVSTNYRLAPDAPFPIWPQDVAAAIAFVHSHIAEHGGDPSHICMMGRSAGAHLVALVATDGAYLASHGLILSDLSAVVALDTQAYDVPALAEARGGVLPAAYRAPFGDDPHTWAAASPITHVAPGKGIPPMVIAYSGGMTRLRQSPERKAAAESFAAALQAAGVRAQVVPAPEKTHAEINRQFGAEGDHVAQAVFAFLSANTDRPQTSSDVAQGKTAGTTDVNGESTDGAGGNRPVFFAFSKAMLDEPVAHQQRGRDALESIKQRLEPLGFACHVLQERVRTREEYAQNPAPFVVTGRQILQELETYQSDLGPKDTIIVYSHSHGVQGRQGRPGGLPLDDPAGGLWRPRYLDWQEYAEHLLGLPAQTVVVLTMACHSGGLVDFLNSDDTARSLWQDRRDAGRNFLVMTSQNGHSLSNPRRIDGTVVNPFTYAVTRAFSGEADGYQHELANTDPDGKITLGELVDYVLDETRSHTAPGDKANDPDPQVTGSYNPDAVIAVLPTAPAQPASVQPWYSIRADI